jgi:hypothetical protein
MTSPAQPDDARTGSSEGLVEALHRQGCDDPDCRARYAEERDAVVVLDYLRAHPEDPFMVEVRAAAQQAEADRWIALMVDALALNRGEIDQAEFRRRTIARASSPAPSEAAPDA